MWLATKIGFFSIVHKPSHLDPDGPAVFQIRARDKADLGRISTKHQIHEYQYSDYPYRIIAKDASELQEIMNTLADSIDYDNFKDEIERTPHQRAKLKAYKELWHGLYESHEKKRPK